MLVIVSGGAKTGRSALAQELLELATAEGVRAIVVDSLTGAEMAIEDGFERVIFDPPALAAYENVEVRYTAGLAVSEPGTVEFDV